MPLSKTISQFDYGEVTMYIKIEEKIFNKDTANKDNIIFASNLHDIVNYYAIDNYGTIVVDKEWYDKDEHETKMLCNTKVGKIEKKDIYVKLSDIKQKEIPVFGVTLEDNFSINQLNIKRKDINNSSCLSSTIKNISMFAIFDKNKNLNICGKIIDKNKIDYIIDAYNNIGYAAPLVLYADKSFIRPYYNDEIAFIYELFNLEYLPVRIITYKDIKYIENMDDVLYKALKKIPYNDFFVQEDKKDYSPYMVDNYSDKKKIINSYKEMRLINFDGKTKYKLLDDNYLTEVIPYIFNDKYSHLNDSLIANINSHNYLETNYYENGARAYDLSISETLYHFLKGYEKIEESTFNGFDKLTIKKEIDFDPSLLSLDTFDYTEANDDKIKEITGIDFIDKFGRNSMCEMLSNELADMHYLTVMLNKEEKKIRILA